MQPHEQLKAYIDQQGLTPGGFARALGYDRANFHRIINGTLRPSIDLAHRIDEHTGGAVPMRIWARAA